MHRVFIYGTLKQGFPNYEAGTTEFSCAGRFRTTDAFPLVVGGRWFSPYLIAEPGVGHRVFGEVFEVDDRGLEKLDRMEGTHVPNGYRRVSIKVEDEYRSGTFDAWTYVKDRDMIEGIHSEPMEEYAPDPRYVIPSKRTSNF
ncbi:MAG: gamma-glutamylcyclotransferase [Gammaproteobacteria bacterium]|jgi:gamma-glutamylaminecyclotransferase|nr:gamma-glutamylcyclotransferase [Gammaproteobacteria bacterium]